MNNIYARSLQLEGDGLFLFLKLIFEAMLLHNLLREQTQKVNSIKNLLKTTKKFLKQEKKTLKELRELQALISIYKTENPSSKFFVWCQDKKYKLTRYQQNLLNEIKI